MADKIVRSINGVRNIDKLSRNITTENDLISTTDNEVYVVTNEGYKKITWSELESDIEHIETDVSQLLSDTSNHKKDINTLKEKTDNNKSLIEAIDLSGYAKKEDIPDEVDLSGYAKKEDIPDEVDLSGYAKKEDIPDEVDLSGYAKKEDVPTNYNKKITQTDWIELPLINNVQLSSRVGYKPSYKIINFGDVRKVLLRFGVINLKNGSNYIAQLPTELIPYDIYGVGVSTIAKTTSKINIQKSNGNIGIFTNSSDDYKETDYVIHQGEWFL